MIEMIAGVFGLPIKDKNGYTIRIKGMGPADGPFSVAPEREAELVEKGIARYVGEPPEDPNDADDSTSDPIGFDDMPPDDFDETSVEDDAELVDLKSLSAKELRGLGKEYGLSFKANDKKETMIEAIFAAQTEIATSEDAPVFDAAEAVE